VGEGFKQWGIFSIIISSFTGSFEQQKNEQNISK
jgi:hypothetical protein